MRSSFGCDICMWAARWLAIFAVLAAVHVTGSAAVMSITTTESVYRAGDSVVLSATITPSAGEEGRPADLYVMASVGNGAMFSLMPGFWWAPGSSPLFRGFPLRRLDAPQFHSFDSTALPNGIYTLYALAVMPGANPMTRANWLGSSVTTFTIHGSGAASAISRQTPVRLQASVVDARVHTFTDGEPMHQDRSHLLEDLDGDGYPELVVGMINYPNQSAEPVLVVGAKDGLTLPATTMFGGNTPVSQCPPVVMSRDINGDGLRDLVVSNCGLDHPPWTGGPIAVALNQGGGRFRNVSSSVPTWLGAARSYAVAVGDLRGNGTNQIVLPGQTQWGTQAALTWNGSGFNVDTGWVLDTVWFAPPPGSLDRALGAMNQASWMGIYDLDGDGKQDLIASGNMTRPSLRVLYGTGTPPLGSDVATLPQGPFGYTVYEDWFLPGNPSSMGADANVQIVADFNDDGRLDIFSLQEQILYFQPGVFADRTNPAYDDVINGGSYGGDIALQVLVNAGSRTFVDRSQFSSHQNLGPRYYSSAWTTDLNNDGYLDVVGVYWTKPNSNDRRGYTGTTYFLNDGTAAFHVVDAADTLPGLQYQDSSGRSQLGHLFPTRVTRSGMDAIVLENHASFWDETKTFRFKKVVVQGSIGTGPGLQDPASRGVPGFNEFYYLNTYPDALQSVVSGSDATGLDHYLRVGRSLGYSPSASRVALRRR